MLQLCSTVYYYTPKRLNSYPYITKTYHEGKPLPIGTFVLKRHFTPYHPKELLLHPHCLHFMRFSDSINSDIKILKPIKYANSVSSPFNSNESLYDDTSSLDDQNSSTDDLFQNSSNTNRYSNTTSPFKQILKALDTNHSFDRVRHPSQNQTPKTNQYSDRTRNPSQNQFAPPYNTDSRDTKSHYNLRQQPKKDYRLFILPSTL